MFPLSESCAVSIIVAEELNCKILFYYSVVLHKLRPSTASGNPRLLTSRLALLYSLPVCEQLDVMGCVQRGLGAFCANCVHLDASTGCISR